MHISTILKVKIVLVLCFANIYQELSRTSLPCLLEDIRNMTLLNKILEARYDENQVLINSKAEYKPLPLFRLLWFSFIWFSIHCQSNIFSHINHIFKNFSYSRARFSNGFSELIWFQFIVRAISFLTSITSSNGFSDLMVLFHMDSQIPDKSKDLAAPIQYCGIS